MIRSTLPVDNIQLHGSGFIDMKLLWKELETKWNFQLPYQSIYLFIYIVNQFLQIGTHVSSDTLRYNFEH